MRAIASARGWGWPVVSCLLAFAGVTVLAVVHTQIDLGTYLLGGVHARAADLFSVTFPVDHLGFTYPPFAALLFAPVAHVPARAAAVAFSWLNLGALFLLVAACLRAVCRTMERRTVLWWALVLLVPVVLLDPVRQTFLLGQVNIVLTLFVVVDMTMDLPLPRGILVGLAAAVKLTPLILVPYLLLTRQGRAGLRALATFLGAVVVSYALSPASSWAYWTHYVRDPQRAGMLSWIGNQGLIGAFERAAGRVVTTPTTILIVAAVAGFGVVLAAIAYRRSSPVLGLLVVEAAESLANPVSWSHHFIWVVLLIAWLALAEDRPRPGRWWALGVAVLFWAGVPWWTPHGPGVVFAGRGWLLPLSDSYALLFLALLAGAAVRVWRRAPAERRAFGRTRIAPSGA
jgi:alpha-1,2-mannosyltransferase